MLKILKLIFLIGIIFTNGCGLILTGVGYTFYNQLSKENEIIQKSPSRILTESFPVGVQNMFYQTEINSEDPVTFSIISGNLPQGLILHNNLKMIIGTPTEFGDFSFTIQATNSDGLISTKDFLISIKKQLKLLTEELNIGFVNSNYDLNLQTEGGLSPYTYSSENENLNLLGLEINSEGKINGLINLDSEGEYEIKIKVQDSNIGELNQIFRKTYLLKIYKPLSIENESLPKVIEGEDYNIKIDVIGGLLPYTYTLNDSNALGLNLTSDGFLTGRINPNKYGIYNLEINVQDSNNNFISKNLSIEVEVAIKIESFNYINHNYYINSSEFNFCAIENSLKELFIIQKFHSSETNNINLAESWGSTDTYINPATISLTIVKINADSTYNNSLIWGSTGDYFYPQKLVDVGDGFYIIGYLTSSSTSINFGAPFGLSDVKTKNTDENLGFLIKLDYNLNYIFTETFNYTLLQDGFINTSTNELLLVGAEQPNGGVRYYRIDLVSNLIVESKFINCSNTFVGQRPRIIGLNQNIYIIGQYQDNSFDFGQVWGTSHIKIRSSLRTSFIIHLNSNNYVDTKIVPANMLFPTASLDNLYFSGLYQGYINIGEDFGLNEETFSSEYSSFVLKLDSDLNFKNKKLLQGTGYFYNGTILYKDDGLYISGYFSKYINLKDNFNVDCIKYCYSEKQSIYLKLDSDLNFKWCRTVECTAQDVSFFLTNNNIYLLGKMRGLTRINYSYDFPENNSPSINLTWDSFYILKCNLIK